jgi:hypothetical protein
MIRRHTGDYKFSKPLIEIRCVCPAYNDSVVVISEKTYLSDCLQHYDKSGELLFQHVLTNNAMPLMCMPNDRIVFVAAPNDWQILLFDLQHQTVRAIEHHYACSDAW